MSLDSADADATAYSGPKDDARSVRSSGTANSHINQLERQKTGASAAKFFYDSKPEVPELDLTEEYFHSLKTGVPMPGLPADKADYQIDWLGPKDPGLAINWPLRKKIRTLCLCALAAMVTVFGSAILAPAAMVIKEKFHVGLPVSILNVSLYVLGFALGPVVWGPSSEYFGRKWPQIIGIFGLTVFSFAAATAKDFQTLVLSRFFSGLFGAATLAVSPAVMADIFDAKERGVAVSVISLMIVAGPMLAPVIGGYITASFLGWRWDEYILGIFSSFVLVILVLFFEESYPPRLLAFRAHDIRKATGNWAVTAPIEDLELDLHVMLEKTVLKPLKMLAVEPILFLISLYHGFIYGILYLCLECVPLIFEDYGWKGGNVFLPYLGMLVGTILVSITNLVIFEPRFNRILAASPSPVLPEERLPLMMLSGIAFPVGIFLLCWSGAYHAMWFVPTVGCAFIGYGLIGIFQAAFTYIIDTYLLNAASGIAANTFLRSAFGCAFPLFAHPMFVNLGTQWAGTLLGCLAAVLAPVPFCFYFYGKTLRSKSRFAFTLDIQAETAARQKAELDSKTQAEEDAADGAQKQTAEA